MVYLHGIWFADMFHLWGEETESPATGRPIPPGQATSGTMADHPAALDLGTLHAAVGELSPDGLLASIAAEGSLTVWLPAVAGIPLPSDDARVDFAADEAPVELARFTVPTLVLEPADAIDLLASLPEPWPRPCGASLAYWSKLARYVLDLLARGQFVPDLELHGDDSATARWRPVVRDRQEHEWLQRFAAVMPPICRAVTTGGVRGQEAVALLESFLHACIDAVIRRALNEDPFFHQIHERATGGAPGDVRWLSALIGDEPALAGTPDERVAFKNLLRAWVGRIDDAGAAEPTRLCIELTEPEYAEDEMGTETWRLAFRLQSMHDASKLHDLSGVWGAESTGPRVLQRRVANQREHVLADLARAAEVFPRIEETLRGGAPGDLELSTLEASTFMRDAAPLLEARGFGVVLPEWAQRRERQLGLRLFIAPHAGIPHGNSIAPAGLGLGSLVDFEWRIAVGDADLTLEDFEQLRAAQAPLVRLRDEWVYLDAEAAEIAARHLAAQRRGQMTLGQALRTAAGLGEQDIGLPVFGIDAAAWLERLLRAAAGARLERVTQPEEFRGELRPYQLRGLEWLTFMHRVGLGACLADDMGLGKTIQLISLLLEERHHSGSPGPTLIFSPMSVVGNWHREIERFAPTLNVFVHHGADRLDGDDFVEAATRTDAVITTYALGHRDLETLRRVAWHRIVLDEAQKIKNPSAAQTIAIRSLPSTHRLALTGTPLENHLSELWSIMEMLNPGLLGSAANFRKRFAVPIERLGDQQRAGQLRRLIHPFVLRRIKSDPDVECDLPEKMEMRVFCNLTVEQAALYEQIVAGTLGEVEQATGIRRRGVILAALTRLKQVCNHPAHFLRDGAALDNRSGKCERLVEMLEEVLAEDDAALVFTQFREMGDLLVRLLTERLHAEVLFLHGGTTAKQRQAMIDRFQDEHGGVRVFLLSLRAGGLGLNLTAANHVFHFDRWWNPAVEQQATDRAYRIGQTRRVQVHKFVCIGTIEDRIDRMLADKTALAERIVGSGDDWLTSLSTDELREYLTLSREAIGDF